MNKWRAATILFPLLMLTSTFSHAMSAREVMDKVHEVSRQELDRKTQDEMTLYDGTGGKRTRGITEYGKNAFPEAYKVLVIFNSPSDLKGVGFLIHARTFAERDMWAYFPEYRRVRRIPPSSQDDSFFGSDFSYDDFSGQMNPDDFAYRILNEEVVDGKPCVVIEVTPKKRRKYTRSIIWVAKDLWIKLKVEYYRGDELYREGSFGDIRMIDGIPTPFKLEMKNLKTAHRTVLTLERIYFHTDFPDGLFSQQSLERGGIE